MRQILDLHIHSPYSRACSPQLTFKNIEKTCLEKGVNIIATGDFTHPAWFKAIKNELSETFTHSGLYRLNNSSSDRVKFILSTEVALIYKDKEKVRRIHLVVHAPNLEAAFELNQVLDARFNLKSDGRPILGIKAPEFVRLLLNINPNFLIYPAHIWTPWFSVFGSKSGFDSLEQCFQEEVSNIYAIETGLSSDPAMNWRLSSLDNLTILSSSDAHSPVNIGREATVMELSVQPSYREIYNIIKHNKQGAGSGLLYTIEFYPEEGMYHLDGHRSCHFSCLPAESTSLKNVCPSCQKPLVLGVLNRVNELADRPLGFKPKNTAPFKKTIELDKIIAEALGIKNRQALKVKKEYQILIESYGNELDILLEINLRDLASQINPKIVEGIRRVREEQVFINPGFDGQYGQVNIFTI
jgi:uncharacterized protein (TIGR00375 family)